MNEHAADGADPNECAPAAPVTRRSTMQKETTSEAEKATYDAGTDHSPAARRPVFRLILAAVLAIWLFGGSLFYFYRFTRDFYERHRDAIDAVLQR